VAHGRLTTFIRWLEALPKAHLRTWSHLHLYQGWALNLSGQIDVAERILQDTKAKLQSLPPSSENKALRAQLAWALVEPILPSLVVGMRSGLEWHRHSAQETAGWIR
jgi:ATP/maltotriose-dependent transcriptional regulator MalT